MNDRVKKTVIGAVGAVVGVAALREGLDRVIDHGMVEEALDRQEPKAMVAMKSKLMGYSMNSKKLEEYQKLCDALANSDHEAVTMESFDGTHLTGHLFRNVNARRVVLAMHGWRSSWTRDFAMIADFFRESGCTVLYAEQRGQGESGGEYMGFGMIERFDCLEWIRWLNRNGFSGMPVYLAGISMGATTVLMTAGFPDLPANVRGIIADCGFTSAKAEWKYISEQNLRLPYGRREKHVDRLCRKRLEMDSDAYTTLDAMAVCRVPVLFIHGAADTFVPMQMSQENYDACCAEKALLIVEGANHGMSYLTDRDSYEAAVKEFWQKQEQWEKV